MNKEVYLQKIATKCQITKILAAQVVDAFIDELREAIVENDKINITNLGVFSKTQIKPKVIFSPIDGSTIKTDSYYRVTFTCSKKLLECLKNNHK